MVKKVSMSVAISESNSSFEPLPIAKQTSVHSLRNLLAATGNGNSALNLLSLSVFSLLR